MSQKEQDLMSMKTCLPSGGSSLGPGWPQNVGLAGPQVSLSLDLRLTGLHFDTYCLSDICALWRKWNQPDVEGDGRCDRLTFLVDPCQTASQLKAQQNKLPEFYRASSLTHFILPVHRTLHRRQDCWLRKVSCHFNEPLVPKGGSTPGPHRSACLRPPTAGWSSLPPIHFLG